jgi:hypothetical protein
LRLIKFARKRFSVPPSKYSASYREYLSRMWEIEEFHYYLYGLKWSESLNASSFSRDEDDLSKFQVFSTCFTYDQVKSLIQTSQVPETMSNKKAGKQDKN